MDFFYIRKVLLVNKREISWDYQYNLLRLSKDNEGTDDLWNLTYFTILPLVLSLNRTFYIRIFPIVDYFLLINLKKRGQITNFDIRLLWHICYLWIHVMRWDEIKMGCIRLSGYTYWAGHLENWSPNRKKNNTSSDEYCDNVTGSDKRLPRVHALLMELTTLGI